MNNTSHMQTKTYHQHPFYSWLLAFYLVIIFCGTVYLWHRGLTERHYSDIKNAFFGSLFIPFLLLVILSWRKMHIEVSSAGVTFRSTGFCMYTPWSNIACTQAIKYPHFSPLFDPIPVFALKVPAIRHLSVQEGMQRGIAVIEKDWALFYTEPIFYSCYFPLPNSMIRTQEWDTGVFGLYLRHYLPLLNGHHPNNYAAQPFPYE